MAFPQKIYNFGKYEKNEISEPVFQWSDHDIGDSIKRFQLIAMSM